MNETNFPLPPNSAQNIQISSSYMYARSSADAAVVFIISSSISVQQNKKALFCQSELFFGSAHSMLIVRVEIQFTRVFVDAQFMLLFSLLYVSIDSSISIENQCICRQRNWKLKSFSECSLEANWNSNISENSFGNVWNFEENFVYKQTYDILRKHLTWFEPEKLFIFEANLLRSIRKLQGKWINFFLNILCQHYESSS